MNPIAVIMFGSSFLLAAVAAVFFSGNKSLVRDLPKGRIRNPVSFVKFIGKAMAMIAFTCFLTGITASTIGSIAALLSFAVLISVAVLLIKKESKEYYR